MAYDLETGKELWRVRYKGFSLASRPLTDGVRVYIPTGFMRAQLYAVELAGSGDVTDEKVAWTWRRNVPKMPSPLLVGDRIFMVDDGGYATCLDARTGEPVWRHRLGGEHSGSPLCVGDRIYFFDREGRTVVLAKADEYRELAENHLESGFMASPAVVGDALVLRTRKHLYRNETKREPPPPGRIRSIWPCRPFARSPSPRCARWVCSPRRRPPPRGTDSVGPTAPASPCPAATPPRSGRSRAWSGSARFRRATARRCSVRTACS
jgi:hypothetical protein